MQKAEVCDSSQQPRQLFCRSYGEHLMAQLSWLSTAGNQQRAHLTGLRWMVPPRLLLLPNSCQGCQGRTSKAVSCIR